MTKYLQFELDDGSLLYVEIEKAPVTGLVPSGLETTAEIKKAEKRFEDALDSVWSAADTLVKKMKRLPERPSEIEVTFGLTASGELGGNFFVAKAGLEANYSVKLTWKQQGKSKSSSS